MLSERLAEFLKKWADVESDPADVSRVLAIRPATGFALWLQDDLRSAILGGDLTPEVAQELTGAGPVEPDDVDEWLRDLWGQWFPGDPYPEA